MKFLKQKLRKKKNKMKKNFSYTQDTTISTKYDELNFLKYQTKTWTMFLILMIYYIHHKTKSLINILARVFEY